MESTKSQQQVSLCISEGANKILPPSPPALPTEAPALCDTEISSTTIGTGFLDLPAELRNKIYRLTLCHWRSIFIGDHNVTLRRSQRTHKPHLDVSCGWDSDSLDKSKIGNHITAAILRTSKQIHHEATPILYGGNSFFLCATPHFRSWAQQIGASFALLRMLEIPINVAAERLPLRPHSVKAVHLKHLTLSISVFHRLSVERIAEYLACFLGHDTACSGNSLRIEIMEDSYSEYARSRNRNIILAYPFGGDGDFESYGDEIKAELGQIMMSEMK